jgi:hypothetical protein
MDFVAANHLGEGEPKFGGAHRAGQANHHAPAAIEMFDIAVGGVHKRRSIEMPVMVLDKPGNRAAGIFFILFIHAFEI